MGSGGRRRSSTGHKRVSLTPWTVIVKSEGRILSGSPADLENCEHVMDSSRDTLYNR